MVELLINPTPVSNLLNPSPVTSNLSVSQWRMEALTFWSPRIKQWSYEGNTGFIHCIVGLHVPVRMNSCYCWLFREKQFYDFSAITDFQPDSTISRMLLVFDEFPRFLLCSLGFGCKILRFHWLFEPFRWISTVNPTTKLFWWISTVWPWIIVRSAANFKIGATFSTKTLMCCF